MGEYFRKVVYGNVFSYLKWDSEYFKLPCYKLVLFDAKKTDITIKEIYQMLPKHSFLTIINEGNNKDNNEKLTNFFGNEMFFADFNIKFKRKCIQPTTIENSYHISISDGLDYDMNIDTISKSAFKYSRFFNDQYLEDIKKKNIYSHWVNTAFNSKERYFLTIKNNENKTIAFLLFNVNIEESSSVIELIAISPNSQQKGLGSQMLKALAEYLSSHAIETLYVGTQSDNIEAMNFYYKNGFKICDCSSIYHVWKK